MSTVWAQRREAFVSDCLVFPDVFHQMVDRLGQFVVPYQHVLETEACQHNVHLYLQGLLSHLPGKNAGSCTWPLRINIVGSPVDRHKGKKS